MSRSSNYPYKLAKAILEKIPTVASFICISLYELGDVTEKAFFNPRYSFTKPSRAFLGIDAKYFPKKIKRETIRQTLKRLQKIGIVEKRNNKIFLSSFGRELLSIIKNKNKLLKKRWDGKYRVVVFDIPEKKRKIRDWLREELILLNYAMLQKSVFIGKHPLTNDIIEAINNLGISENVNYLLVDKVFDNKLADRL